MKSLKDIRKLSLQLIVATLRDAEQIQEVELSYSFSWIRNQKFPDIVGELSKLGKQVETSLITGSKLLVDTNVFPLAESSDLPMFCYPLFSQIFTESGLPRYILAYDPAPRTYTYLEKLPRSVKFRLIGADGNADPDWVVAQHAASAVMLLRQILLLFSKATDIPVLAEEQDEIASFVKRVSTDTVIKYRLGLTTVFSWARLLLAELLTPEGELHPSLTQWVENPFGRHGPGAVSGREKGREKWSFTIDCLRLPSLLYSDSYGERIGSHDSDLSHLTSRLCVVPKDFRGHRLICAEPKELQFAQQGLLSVLEQIIRTSKLTSNHISLNNQDPSFYLSRNLSYATIDLKDASDHVTMRLCKLLLPKEVYSLVCRFRSNNVLLPNGSIVEGVKTAFTMGNALCFPMETLIFWALSVATIISDDGRSCPVHLSDEDLVKRVSKLRMKVFGDDIIVPLSWCRNVTEVLTHAGLVVNPQKTCELTLVRESCGSWWYAGFDCRIIRLKYAAVLDLQSWTSFQDVIPLLRESGMNNLASELDEFCCLIYPTREWFFYNRAAQDHWLRQVEEGSDIRAEFVDRRHFVRFNLHLQRMEYRAPTRSADHMRALPGRLGLTAYWTEAATRSLYTNVQRIKYRWVAL